MDQRGTEPLQLLDDRRHMPGGVAELEGDTPLCRRQRHDPVDAALVERRRRR